MAQKEGINTPLVVTLGIISSILLVVIAFTVEGWFQYQEHAELAAKWQTMSDQTAAQRKAEQIQSISEYRWVDEKKGIVAIPIDQAMKDIAENGGKVPWQANPQK